MQKNVLVAVILASALLLISASTASAAPATYQFGGTISSTMSVNNGTNTGTIPAGTPYTGTLAFDDAQPATPVAFNGGTHSVYAFSSLTFTIGTSTATSGPGTIDVYDNLTSTTGYPPGDSLYVNFTQGVPNTTGVAPNGLLSGAAFNWMGLGLYDPTGQAITGGALPTNLSLASFSTHFSEFNFGTLGTPWGAGNTSMIQTLSSLTKSSGGTPSPIAFAPTLPDGTVNVAYLAAFSPATGGTGAFAYSAAGLPAGLSLSGTTVSGTPTAAGTFNVTLTATDSANSSVSATVAITIGTPTVTVCSGTNAVETAYVARNPGYIVVNGGLNLLDHLWTTNLNASNTTFLGGLVNWYQTGLILNYTGTTDPNGCILDSLTVAPAVTISTTSLPSGTAGVAYQAPVSVSWGVAPYAVTVGGLPAGLSYDGANIVGTPAAAGLFNVTIAATDAVGASATAQVSLTINPGASYTVRDQGTGKITFVDPNYRYVMVGTKKLIWNSSTIIIVNTPAGERHVIDSFVRVGMKVQWKGLRDNATNTVLTNKIEIN